LNEKENQGFLHTEKKKGESRMKTVAYLRVSKDTQDVNNQRLAILQFAQRERIQVDGFIEVTVSTRESVKERKIDMLLDQLFEGDTLIVSELSRIGRSVGEIITIVDTLVKKRVRFLAVKEGIRLDGSQDCEEIQTKVMITLFGLFAEIERKLISMRTREALATAKAAGKKLGRPKGILGKSKLDNQREEIIRLLALSVPKTIIARITGVDRSTIYHFIKSRGLS
jgi:DNA invertase Pin-like site-specific DNA recombinase